MNGIVSASVRSKGYWPVQMEAVYDRVPPLGFVFVDEALNRMGVALARGKSITEARKKARHSARQIHIEYK